MIKQIDSQTLFFWVLAYIVIPFILPPAGVLLIKLLPASIMSTAARRVITVVKDGQLGWVTIAIGCALFFDLWDFRQHTGVLVDDLLTQIRAAHAAIDASKTSTTADLETHLQDVLHVRSPSLPVHLMQIATFFIVVGLTMATAIGAAFPTNYQGTFTGGWKHALLHYHMLVVTAVASAIGSTCYIAVHIWIMQHDVS